MFTHLLPESEKLFVVEFSDYAEKHFLKEFRKDYKGAQWEITEDAILDDLAHLSHGGYDLQRTQQIDELWHEGEIWVFKYDFRVAKTKCSAKTSGNRVIGVVDAEANRVKIAMIYSKTDLPKNMGETQYIKQVLNENCPEIGWKQRG